MTALYDSKSKSIDHKGMKDLFTYDARLQSWLDVEGALARAQSRVGMIPAHVGEKISAKCHVDCIDKEEIGRIMAKIGHGFVPVIKVLIKACDEESGKYVHYGVTTQNIQQTAHLYIVKQFHEHLLGFLDDTIRNIAKLAQDHKDTIMPGRTHGKHALPITYGYKASVWLYELLGARERLQEAEKRVFTVMMGGAVGGFHATGEQGREVQELVAQELGMHSMLVPSRNARIYRAEYISNLALLATTFHKIAEEVYQTSSEEFAEVSEAFTKGTVGSSTMPQKVNPKLAKGIIANSQKLYSVLTSSLYVSPRPFEADSSAYFIFDANLQDSIELMAEIILRAEELTRTLVINKDAMYRNVMITNGLINSEKIMMSLVDRLGKDMAHELVYEMAMKSTHGNIPYGEILREELVSRYDFSEEEVLAMLDPRQYVGLCATIAEEVAALALETVK